MEAKVLSNFHDTLRWIGGLQLHLLLQQPSIFLRIVNRHSLGNIRNLRSLHTAPPSPFVRMLYPQFLFPPLLFLPFSLLFLNFCQVLLEFRQIHGLWFHQFTNLILHESLSYLPILASDIIATWSQDTAKPTRLNPKCPIVF